MGFNGHANGNWMVLNQNYRFTGTDLSSKCIDQSIKKDGEIFLQGCNTATRDHSPTQFSLTERLSKALPTRKITGLEAFLNPFFTLQGFSKDTNIYKSYFPRNSKSEWVFGNSVVSYKNGKKL